MVDKAWANTSYRFASLIHTLDLKSHLTVRLNFEARYPSIISTKSTERLTYEKHLDEILSTRKQHQSHRPPSKTSVVLSENLDHIPMSKDNKEAHDVTYIIDQDTTEEENIHALVTASCVQTINASSNRLNTIMTYWIDRAEELSGRKLDRQRHFPDRYQGTRFLIRGKPGVGKSALINYLFSVNADNLMKRKIIWIRVAMNSMDYLNLSLEGALLYKFLKLFCKYYLLEPGFSFDRSFLDDLKVYLCEKATEDPFLRIGGYDNEELIKQLVENYVLLLGAIRSGAKEEANKRLENGDYDSVKMWVSVIARRQGFDPRVVTALTKWVLSFLQKKYEYGFIFIIDGMDNVSIDFVERRFFREWVKDFRATTDNNQNIFNAIYITAMRDYSFIDFYREVSAPPLDNRVIHFRVSECPLESIIRGKCELAARALFKKPSEVHKAEMYNIICNILNILHNALKLPDTEEIPGRAFYDCFLGFSYMINSNIREGLRFLRIVMSNSEQLLGVNDAPSLLKLTVNLDLAMRKAERKEWLIYRWLIMGAPNVRVYKNKTQYRRNLQYINDHIEEDPILMEHNPQSRAVIPNLFNYCDEIIPNHPSPDCPAILFKLRVIQYLRRKQSKQANKSDIIEWYQDKFGYAYPNLPYILREMVLDGLLNPNVEDERLIEYEISGRDYPVTASNLCFVMLDKILRKNIYYEVISDDTPICSELAKSMTPMSFEEVGEDTDLFDYLQQKTFNLILFLSYLSSIEKIEKKRFTDRAGGNQDAYNQDGLVIFDDDRIESIKKGVSASLATVLGFKAGGHEGAFQNYLDDWYNYFQVGRDDRVYKVR